MLNAILLLCLWCVTMPARKMQAIQSGDVSFLRRTVHRSQRCRVLRNTGLPPMAPFMCTHNTAIHARIGGAF